MSLMDEFTPAFVTRPLEPEEREAVMATCRAQQRKIIDRFGETSLQAKAMTKTFDHLVKDGTDLSWHMGRTFMAWAVQYPSMLGAEDIRNCKCDHDGWTLKDERLNLYRPCARCNPEMFIQYSARAGGSAQEDPALDLADMPVQEEAFGPEEFPEF